MTTLNTNIMLLYELSIKRTRKYVKQILCFCRYCNFYTHRHTGSTSTHMLMLHTCLILLQHILFLTNKFYIYTYAIYILCIYIIYIYIIYTYIYIYVYIYNVYIKKKEVSYTIGIQYVNLKC